MTVVHERFMRLALEEAQQAATEGNLAAGAVITRNGDVLARTHNVANTTFDVTAHAETLAVRELSIRLRVRNPGMHAGTGPLAGCTLYTTVEPCPMCAWATCVGGIAAIVIGVRLAAVGLGYSGDYAIEKLLGMTGQRIEIVDIDSDTVRAECRAYRLRGERV